MALCRAVIEARIDNAARMIAMRAMTVRSKDPRAAEELIWAAALVMGVTSELQDEATKTRLLSDDQV